MNIWQGLFVAVTTPFDNSDEAGQVAIDEKSFGDHLEYLIAGGVRGLVPCGTTGEAATMSREEAQRVISFAVEVADGRVPVVAGVGSNATWRTIAFARDAAAAGADALLVVVPPYNKPTQDGLFLHFAAVADATDLPVVAYNVPGRTASSITPETLARLCDNPKIVAVKEATADMRFASRIQRLCGDRLAILSGDDFTTLPLLSIGACGAISVVGNVDPVRMRQMIEAGLSGDRDRARKLHQDLQPLMNALFSVVNPIPVKYAVSRLGFGDGLPRLPLVPARAEVRERLDSVLVELGLI